MKSYLSNKLVLNWSLRFSQCKRANFYSLCSTLVGLAMFLKFNYRVLSNMTVTASKLGPQHFFYESKNVLIWQNIFTEKVVTVKNEFYQNRKLVTWQRIYIFHDLWWQRGWAYSKQLSMIGIFTLSWHQRIFQCFLESVYKVLLWFKKYNKKIGFES